RVISADSPVPIRAAESSSSPLFRPFLNSTMPAPSERAIPGIRCPKSSRATTRTTQSSGPLKPKPRSGVMSVRVTRHPDYGAPAGSAKGRCGFRSCRRPARAGSAARARRISRSRRVGFLGDVAPPGVGIRAESATDEARQVAARTLAYGGIGGFERRGQDADRLAARLAARRAAGRVEALELAEDLLQQRRLVLRLE